jgi:hypothetical protein
MLKINILSNFILQYCILTLNKYAHLLWNLLYLYASDDDLVEVETDKWNLNDKLLFITVCEVCRI